MITTIFLWVIMLVLIVIFLGIAYEYVPDDFKKLLKKVVKKIFEKKKRKVEKDEK